MLADRLDAHQRFWGLLALAAIVCFLQGLGGYPLFDLDEGAFAEATREMLASGNFITTYLDGELRFDKPILIYWLQAASVSVVGLSEWGFRLPSALAAMGWAAGIALFARRYVDREGGWAAPLFMMTTLVVLVIGRAATADALLNLFIALAGLDIYRYYTHPARSTALRTYLWLGLGFLTKGPIAVAVPVGASLIFFLWAGHWRLWLQALFQPRGWLVFLAVAAPWYVLEYMAQGQAFIDGFFLKHNISRLSDTMERHGGSVFYYVGLLPLILLPHTGLFLRLLPLLWGLRRGTLEHYLWVWFALVFVVFSLSQTQLPHYILYGCTPVFILMALHRRRLASRWLAFVPAVAGFALFAFLPELVALAKPYTPGAYEQAILARAGGAFDTAYRIWTLTGLVLVLGLALWRRWAPWQGLIAAGLIQALIATQAVFPALAYMKQEPVRQAALLARELEGPVIRHKVRMPSFSVYRQAITPDRDPRPGDLVFTRIHKLDDLPAYRVVYSEGGIVLARIAQKAGQ